MSDAGMAPGAVADPPDSPRSVYESRLADRRGTAQRLRRELRRIADARLASVVLAALVGWGAWSPGWWSPWWVMLPISLFVGLVVASIRRRWRADRADGAVAYYESRLAALDDRWAGQGISGARFLPEDHPFAADLDLFGRGSLFERICLARTEAGQRRLADWLLTPAGVDEVTSRQQAVGDLIPRLDMREDAVLLGEDIGEELDSQALCAWGESPALGIAPSLRWLTLTLAIANFIVLLGWWQLGWNRWILVTVWAISGLVALVLGRILRSTLAGLDRRVAEMVLLSELLARLESEPVASARLQALQARLGAGPDRASVRIAALARRLQWLEARRNQMFAPLALLMMWGTQLGLSIERWRVASGPSIRDWLDALAEFEALSSLAGYAYENPNHVFPQVVTGNSRFRARDMGHPLLPHAHCVRNDLEFGGELRVVVVSGSNMSGKSTLLRSVGVNTVLALAGGTVRASHLELTPLALGATLRIQDSLQAGRSRFMAEILRLRQIVELTGQSTAVLFLLDEILHGTNSADRLQGALAVVRGLIDRGAIGLVTTHDLALAQVAETLRPRAVNIHFEDHLVNGQLEFDYKIRPGVVTKSNAIELMRAVGLEV